MKRIWCNGVFCHRYPAFEYQNNVKVHIFHRHVEIILGLRESLRAQEDAKRIDSSIFTYAENIW
jgi:hypothetical protein